MRNLATVECSIPFVSLCNAQTSPTCSTGHHLACEFADLWRLQGEFQLAMKHRRAASRDEQEMHAALMDFQQDDATSDRFMNADLGFGPRDMET